MGFYSTNSETQSRPFPGDLDLSAVMRQVYTWLAVGLGVGFGVAFVGAGVMGRAIESGNFGLLTTVPLISGILYVILAIALYPVVMRSSITVGAILFIIVTGLFGVMLSTTFAALQYTMGEKAQTTIIAAFAATAGMFGAMTLIGYTTKTDLSKLGSILMMALIGLIIASLVNLLLRSPLIYWLVTYAGVLIFCGLTAYDTQWIKNNAAQLVAAGDREGAQRLALIGAFHLFSDFVNLFLYILRILVALSGNSRE